MKKNFFPLLLRSILLLITATSCKEKKVNISNKSDCELIEQYNYMVAMKVVDQTNKYSDAVGWDGKEETYTQAISDGSWAVIEPFQNHYEFDEYIKRVCGCE